MILLGFALAPQSFGKKPHWKPAANVDLAEVTKKTTERAKGDKLFVRQPTLLALRTALFLAGGSFDTPTRGTAQNIKAEFKGGEEIFKSAIITVEFMGYADDSLYGERFVLSLIVDEAGVWKVTKAKRAAFGRGDHR